MAHGGLRLRRLILHLKIWEVVADGFIEIELAHFDQSHSNGGRHRLGDRADLEKGVLRNREGVVAIGDAKARHFGQRRCRTLLPNADGHPWYTGLLHTVHNLIDKGLITHLLLLSVVLR